MRSRGVIAMQKHPTELRGTPSVPFVNPAHLKKVWNFWRDFGGAAVSRTVFELECGPVDDWASYRASMLWVLLFDPDDPLAPWRRGFGLDDVVFRVAAVFPIEWVGEGISQGFPFDVGAFLQQLRDHSGGWVQ
jgi:hypothetical protein